MGHGAELSGCGKCLKFIMFTLNFLTLIGGGAVLGIGIWTLVDPGQMESLLETDLFLSSAIILIVTGSVTVLLSFFGCMGAVKEVKCMLLTYFILMLIIFVTLVIGGILGFVFRDQVKESLRIGMIKSVRDYGSNETQTVTESWDFAQENLKCCGVEGEEGYMIWMKENPLFSGDVKVPKSCCMKDSAGQFVACQVNPTNTTTYTDGCLDAAAQVFEDHAEIIGGVAIGIACVMLLGMIFSMALFTRIH